MNSPDLTSPTLRDKLVKLITEEIAEHGAAYGWFAAAEAHGAYFIREDGKVAGIGPYQQHQPQHGAKNLEDIPTNELGAMLGRMQHIGKNGKHLSALDQSEDLNLTQCQFDWILGLRNDFIEGPEVVAGYNQFPSTPGHWDDEKAREATLGREVRVRVGLGRRSNPRGTLTMPAGTPVRFISREDLPYANAYDLLEVGGPEMKIYIASTEDLISPQVSPSKKPKP